MTDILTSAPADGTIPVPLDERQRYLALLADLRTLLDEHPEVPYPWVNASAGVSLMFCVFSDDALGVIAMLRRLIGGKWDKSPDENGKYFNVTGRWHGFEVVISARREVVCRKVVTGTREVTTKVKDPEALAKVPMVEITETVTDYEWVCSPLLAPRPAAAGEAQKAVA